MVEYFGAMRRYLAAWQIKIINSGAYSIGDLPTECFVMSDMEAVSDKDILKIWRKIGVERGRDSLRRYYEQLKLMESKAIQNKASLDIVNSIQMQIRYCELFHKAAYQRALKVDPSIEFRPLGQLDSGDGVDANTLDIEFERHVLTESVPDCVAYRAYKKDYPEESKSGVKFPESMLLDSYVVPHSRKSRSFA